MGKTMRLGWLTRTALAGFLLAAPLSVIEAHAQEREFHLNIPAQPLSEALRAYARASGEQIVFTEDLVAGREASALQGDYTAEAALDALLRGTGLVAVRTPRGAVMILRQGDPRAASADPASPARLGEAQPAAPSEALVEEEIVVTGTHIRGQAPIGATPITITREDIDKSGYVTTQDILRALPQNFSGGVNEILGTTDASAVNVNYGSAANLRGLGASATLVLVNGRRTVTGGFAGSFVDVSNIPSGAIERIEVLTDGASAIYGSDAIGGVVNIILRKDYEGAEARGRFGTLDGDADEVSASQLFGTNWNGGHVLLGYQYYKRDSLAFTDRSFSADTDQRSRGGNNFSSINSNPGNIIDPLTGQPAFSIPPGQDGTGLTVDDLLAGVTNFHNGAEQNDLLPRQETHSVYLDASQDWESVRLFAEGRYNRRDVTTLSGGTGQTLFVPDTNPFLVDPFGFGFALVAYNFLDDFGPSMSEGESESFSAALGATIDVSETWRFELMGSYAEETNRNATSGVNFTALDEALADPDPAAAFNPFGDGSHTNPATLAAIGVTNHLRAATELVNFNMKLDGSLFALPGGAARLAIGANYYEEKFESLTQEAGLPDFNRGRGRRVSAAFAELALPIVGRDNGVVGVERLDLSLAGRYDEYSDFGPTFNPKFGLSWSPVESLKVRGTWGTSFKAPRLVELEESPATNSAVLLPVADPQAPGGTAFALFLFGNNASLKEETATTWTAGLDFSPPAIPGLDMSLTYYDINYENRVARVGPFQLLNILLEEDRWAEAIERNPSQEEVDAICTSAIYRGTPCNLLPFPTAIIDTRLRNLALIKTRGLDASIQQLLETEAGTFTFGLNGAYVFSFERAGSDTSPLAEEVDTVSNPLTLRLRATASWTSGAWGASATVNYADGYRDTQSEPDRSIDAWTTVDFQVSYETSGGDGWLDDLVFTLSAVNVFDEDPSFVNSPVGFDPTNANAYGRLIGLQVSKRWN